MLDVDKIRKMTKLASYEAKEASANMEIMRYFRTDYVSWQVLKSLLSITVAFGLVLALVILYHFESLMGDLYKMDLLQLAKTVLSRYVVVAVAYGVAVYLLASYRFVQAKNSIKAYGRLLGSLEEAQTKG